MRLRSSVSSANMDDSKGFSDPLEASFASMNRLLSLLMNSMGVLTSTFFTKYM